MIYLIEDKTSRRNDYGWTDEKISRMSNIITVVENASALINLMEEIKADGNVILYHESFTRVENDENKEIVDNFLKDLDIISGVYIVYFSGSKTERKCEGHICNINYDPMYTNLDAFIRHSKKGQFDFKYLMFGDNPEIEDHLRQNIIDINKKNIDDPKIESEKKLLVYRTYDEPIDFPILTATIKDDCDFSCKDEDLIAIVEDQNSIVYDAIYIPLCMGETLSDFLGLRLALLFRLVDTVNKYSQIFIYGVARYQYFFNNECVEILKMKGVDYIPADSESIINSLNRIKKIDESEYRLGLKKIHLNVPTNIGDNHSVANKWARYRWSEALNDNSLFSAIDSNDILNTLFFKYLQALYPSGESLTISPENFLIEIIHKTPKANLLLVDDEAELGWFKILSKICCQYNNLKMGFIGNEMKSKSREEIVELVMDEVINKKINLVILDFRLHPNDFEEKDITKITGYVLLDKIKKYNPGIQVIILSATNKIWNLQALLQKDADAFILKESPENSSDSEFTQNVILKFVEDLQTCVNSTYLYQVYNQFLKIRLLYCKIFSEDDLLRAENYMFVAFELLKLSYKMTFVNSESSKKYMAHAYLQLYQLLEFYVQHETIFYKDESDRCYYVKGLDNLYKVLEPINEGNKEFKSAIQYKEINKYYVEGVSNYSRSIDTNFRMSSVLIFLYGAKNSDFHGWNKIAYARNTRAAHPENGQITEFDFKLIIDFILFLFDYSNRNEKKSELSYEEGLYELMKKYNSN